MIISEALQTPANLIKTYDPAKYAEMSDSDWFATDDFAESGLPFYALFEQALGLTSGSTSWIRIDHIQDEADYFGWSPDWYDYFVSMIMVHEFDHATRPDAGETVEEENLAFDAAIAYARHLPGEIGTCLVKLNEEDKVWETDAIEDGTL